MPNLARPIPYFSHFGAAVILLAIIGLCACQNSVIDDDVSGEVRVDDAKVARVEGTYIFQSDIERYANWRGLSAKPDTPGYAQILEELVDQRLLARDAQARGLNGSETALRQLAITRERILSSVRAETYVNQVVNEAAIRAEYDQQVALGRSTGTFDESRADIETLLTAKAIQSLLQTLRADADIQLIRADAEQDTED